MANNCDVCGKNAVLYMAEYVAEDGIKIKKAMCYNCISQFRQSGKKCQILHVLTNNHSNEINRADPPDEQKIPFSSYSTLSYDSSTNTSMDWTKIFKTVNIILLAASVISGMIGGAVFLVEAGWGLLGILAGGLLGALAGFLGGMVTVSLAMVIVEISQKLSDIRDSQNKQNELTQKLIEALEKRTKNNPEK